MTENPPQKNDLVLNEEKILKFWKEKDIFKKTLEKKSPKGEFVFYEGPPTANGKPGIHHLEARAFKDIIPRYKTMQGYHVARKGGWDTHGLPVELQVEKALGLKSKKEIEAFGVEAFNKKCKESVWEYVDLWQKFTDRIGYWLDLENPYITYEKTYMESVWNILKQVEDKKLLYKDYKVVPWCPRCGTALSSHELAQGYEEVKDLSVYVKFRVKSPSQSSGHTNTYVLVWTTTPWTLPGNVALAIGEKVEYVKVKFENEFYILAKSRLSVLAEGYEEVGKVETTELLKLSYEPLYPYLEKKFKDKNPEAFEKAYKVYAADFVTTEDGTGIVHTAVMYGQDDFELGTKIGLPKHHLVEDDGHFVADMDFLSGRFVKDEETAVEIIKDLAHRGLLFKKEKYAHTYPHCWRCKTPLIYYARDSWYIKMSALRSDLVKENEKINWEPEHIKEGRFGEWLKEVKDWAISRERYWGTSLPIWEDKDGNRTVIGSVEELKNKIPKRNNFFLMRHGESVSNTNDEISCVRGAHDPLTEKGIEQAKKTAKDLKKKHIDVIITSPFMRSKQTAEIVAKEIGFTGEIVEDTSLGELVAEEWQGKKWSEYQGQFEKMIDRFRKHIGNAENWEDMRKRVVESVYEVDAKYEGKNILLVGHGGPFTLVVYASEGKTIKEMGELRQDRVFKNAEVKEIDWRNLPHNDKFEIDLHKPFIDNVTLFDEKGNELKRVKEVLDVWFDSGAMPFAQHHFMSVKRLVPRLRSGRDIAYPADFISEAIDQTRGWFYTLHAVGTLMGKGRAYNNVICLGHILDAEGKKMSKSLGNIVDPWMMMDKYGVDALRMWMYTVNQPGDSKNFDERTVDEIVKKVFNLLSNIVTFYEMYADESITASDKSSHVLDRWIISRLNQLVQQGTESLDNFKVFEAARAIRDFAGDFSTWYVRRSRDRFKSDDIEDKNAALATTRFVLQELSKYMAPFTPFFAEAMYQKVKSPSTPSATLGTGRSGQESVHLEDWPKGGKVDQELLETMQKVRETVSLALDVRQKANVKVRQPLKELRIKNQELRGKEEFIDLVKDEVNVKEVVFDDIEKDIELDTEVTQELQEEGDLREIIRAIQDLRKQQSLKPSQKIVLYAPADKEALVNKYLAEVKRVSNVEKVVTADEMRIEVI